MTEAEFRSQMGIAANQPILYRASDGSEIGYAEFGMRVQAGSSFQMKKAAGGAVSLQLQTASAVSSARQKPDILPPVNLTTIDGRPLRSADFADRALLVSFFFAECVPCIQEVPILNAFASRHSEYRYLAITFDSGDEAAHFVQRTTSSAHW